MAELSPIMQDSMKEEEDIVLYRYKAKNQWLRHIRSVFLEQVNEAIICTVTVWRVLVLPVKRIAWSTWSWRLGALKWTRQTPAIRGTEKMLVFLWIWWTKSLTLMVSHLMPIPLASQDATYVSASSQRRPISAPISGLETHLVLSNSYISIQ